MAREWLSRPLKPPPRPRAATGSSTTTTPDPTPGIANRPPISRVHDLRVQEQLVSFSDRGGPAEIDPEPLITSTGSPERGRDACGQVHLHGDGPESLRVGHRLSADRVAGGGFGSDLKLSAGRHRRAVEFNSDLHVHPLGTVTSQLIVELVKGAIADGAASNRSSFIFDSAAWAA